MKHNECSLLQKAKQIPRIALVRKAPPATGEFAVFLRILAFSKEAQDAEWQALMLEIQEERQTLQENGLIPTEQVNSEK